MARLSHTVCVVPFSSILSAGTLPEGECALICDFVSGRRNGVSASSKPSLAIFMASHDRKLQEEMFLLPMKSV